MKRYSLSVGVILIFLFACISVRGVLGEEDLCGIRKEACIFTYMKK